MRLYKEGDKYICEPQIGEHNAPHNAGFVYAKDASGRWETLSPYRAATLWKYAEPEALGVSLQNVSLRMKRNLFLGNGSEIASLGISASHSEGNLYLPFQQAGIQFMLENAGVLLADEMGLGKTIQAIGLLNAGNASKTLIICPASLKLNWKRELEKWLVKKLSIGIAFSTNVPQTDIVIINWDIIDRNLEALCLEKWDVIIGDESSAVKNPKSHRARAFLKLQSKKRILLNGTPILNRPSDLWTSLKWLDPVTWNNWYAFATRYCEAYADRWGLHADGASNTQELSIFLRATCMLMRKKSEVMKELPPVFRQVIEVPCTDETKIETEWQAFNHYQQMLEGYRKAKRESTAGDTEGFRKRLSEMRQSVRIAFQDLARARHDCALYKLPAIVEHLRATAECNKCISFSHHKDLIAALRDAFPSSLSLLSEMNVTQRQAVLDRFNLADDRLLLTSIRLGLGYNATGCHHVVFSELDWTPAIMAQCEARIHRKGQTENCLVQYIVLENSVDSMMARQLVQKQNVIDSFERRA